MPDPAPPALLRHAVTPVHGRYFVRPAAAERATAWLVGFHGEAQTAEGFLQDLERCPRGPTWLVASVQGLNRWYTGRTRAIVAGWMTSQDRELAIADNVAWVDQVLDRLEGEFGAPERIVFAGFSQGVAMAYRAGLLGRREASAIVAASGDVPPELPSRAVRRWPRLLVAGGIHDTWYTPARLEADLEVLRVVRPEVQALAFDGGHEWSDDVVQAVARLLADVERSAD